MWFLSCEQCVGRWPRRVVVHLASWLLACLALGVMALAARAETNEPQPRIASSEMQSVDLRECPPDIAFGETIKCSIEFPAEEDTYFFTAAAGDKVLVQVSVMGGLWPGISVFDPAGNAIPGCSAGGIPSTVTIPSCNLATDGIYRIRTFDANGRDNTGSYHLYLQRLNNPAGAASTNFGRIATGAILTPAEMDMFAFSGKSGDKVLVELSVTDWLWPGVSIYDPDGNAMPGCDAGGIPPTVGISSCTLAKDGVHHVLVFDGRGRDDTGNYFLYLQRRNNPVNIVFTAYGINVAGTILTPAEIDVFSFSGKAGDKVSANLSVTGSLWPGMKIIDPDGEDVPGCSAGGIPPTASIPSCTLLKDGVHHILVYDSRGNDNTGDYRLFIDCLSCPPGSIPKLQSLVLIYAVLDNNLGDDPETWMRLVNNAEAGITDTVRVRLLVDGPQTNDSYVYDLQHDDDDSCPSPTNLTCGRYVKDTNFWDWGEDTAHPKSLYRFVVSATTDFAGVPSIILALAGHGSGWNANYLPEQPSRWGSQPSRWGSQDEQPPIYEERVGGFLWDDNPGDGGVSRSFSTKALGVTLNGVKADTGRTIDLLYLDACSMGMAEVTYELRYVAHYLLASPNTDWASFAYDRLLPTVAVDKLALTIGQEWLTIEASGLVSDSYPSTLALYDLTQLDGLANATKGLATALTTALADQKTLISNAVLTTDHFESDYNGVINNDDAYVDLMSLALRLESQFATGTPVRAAVQTLKGALANFVVGKRITSGTPWVFPNQQWKWNDAGGLSIYFPASGNGDASKRALYTSENLQWLQATRWHDFLNAYWPPSSAGAAGAAGQAVEPLPTCNNTRECPGLATVLPLKSSAPGGDGEELRLYLPILAK